mgnify:CR=1 FL=1|tara:strand:+ start:7340 stop:7570 length:231 start_codon:yes stop_codon:yes gene_type:complete
MKWILALIIIFTLLGCQPQTSQDSPPTYDLPIDIEETHGTVEETVIEPEIEPTVTEDLNSVAATFNALEKAIEDLP